VSQARAETVERRGREAAPPEQLESWAFAKGAEIAAGRYAVRLLGGGVRYETYLAWDDRLLSLVVVKILRPHLVDDDHARRGLGEETELLERLRHPVLVRSLDLDLDGPRPHVVLEHLEGPRLSTLVRKYGPVEREQLLPLGLQLCSAAHYLREEEIVHLDIKPSNIIMGAPARLIDLSVAQPLAVLARKRKQIGTDAYMAPEQCDPEALGPVTSAADVWGIGATLHHAASGSPPFPTPREGEPRFPQLHDAPLPLPEKVHPQLRALLESCLRRAAADRPLPAEVAAELELLVDELPKRLVLGRFRVRTR
jgi:serine/threonine protein kinase